MNCLFLVLVFCAVYINAKPHFFETFEEGWEKFWVPSKSKDDYGKFVHKEGGISTSEDAKFYAISRSFPEFTNKDKDLVVMLSVKHPQKIDCGGGYIKLFPAGTDLETFSGDTIYNIMFGPDICGPPTKKIHFIHHYDNDNKLWNKQPKAETDELSHIYQFHLKPDNSYTVSVDGKQVESGTLEADWNLLPPKMINDPEASKPADWVDTKRIPDPTDTKPADWDDEPAQIVDSSATKPDDWDTELDGEWEAPLIDNPKYKGEWRAKMIDNPAYKGEWVHPQVPNPEYKEDNELYLYKSFGGVGIDIWQVKSGTIFDNIWIGDNVEEANKYVEEVFLKFAEEEKKAHEKAEEERKKQEEQAAKNTATEEDDDDDDDDDDEDDKKEDHSGHGHDEL